MKNKFKFISILLCLCLIGCASSYGKHIKDADQYHIQSELFFKRAVVEYEAALKDTKDPVDIYFTLGVLFYQHGDFDKAIEKLSLVDSFQAKKLLAMTYFKTGDYTDALSIFNKAGEQDDAEYLYYYGLTCEKHNLFSRAREIYNKIESTAYLRLAKERLSEIDSFLDSQNIKIDPFVSKLIEEAPTSQDYPQAGAVILFTNEEITLNPDNTMESIGHYVIKVLNERGKHFGEVEVGYDSTFEKVELIYARTIKPDGEVASVGQKHMRDVSKYLNFPLYSNARAMIVSMPEVTEGCIIDYKIRHFRSRLINEKDFFTAYYLADSEPVMHAKFKISLPKERGLNISRINEKYNYTNANLEPKVIQENGRRIYTWEFSDIPEIIPEVSMPDLIEINPMVLFSTANSWDDIYKWWWNLAKDKISVNQDMKKLVADLVKDKASPEDKARAVYNWCIQNIRYVGIEYGQAGHEPHNAVEIFKNKYGDCKDQSILLISLLKEAGVEAYPVLILTEGSFILKKDFPMLLFNHCIAVANINAEYIFLDPTGETVSFRDLPIGDQDKDVLVFLKDNWEFQHTPLFDSSHNLNKVDMKITINDDESILAERNIYTFGFFDQAQRYWLKYTKPILYEETLKQKAQGISPGAQLLDHKIDNINNIDQPIKLSYKFSGPEYLIRAGKARVIGQLGSIDLSLVAKDERQYDIDFGSLDSKVINISFVLPEHLKVKFLPEPVKHDNQWFEFVNQYEHKDNVISFIQRSSAKSKIVKKEDYAEFKKLLEGISREINQCIVLERE